MGIFRWLAQKAEDSIRNYKANKLQSHMDEVGEHILDLKNDDADVRENAAEALGGNDVVSDIPALIEAPGDKDVNVRSRASFALKKMGKPTVPTLIEALGDKSSEVRWKAAEVLGEIKNASAVPALVEALGDEYEDVRWSAAGALGMIGDALLRCGASRQSQDFLEFCDIAVPVLAKTVEDDDYEVRWAAANSLGMICNALLRCKVPRRSPDFLEFCNIVIPVMIEHLKDVDGGMRYLAAETLGKIGDAAVSALVEALGDKNANVRRSATGALEGILRRCNTLEALESFEKGLSEGFDALRGKRRDKDKLIEIKMKIAELMKEVSEKKNELASKRDVLLDAKPKPPKGGRMYQAARMVRNG